MTIERLELLSDDVLANLSKKIGIRVKQDWDRSKMIDSIIEVMEEDRIEKESLLNLAVSIESKKYSVTINEELDLAYDVDEEMVLPDRYNENMLHFLLRDNSWGFIMWDIKDSLNLKYQNQLEDVNYILRIIELDEAEYSTDAIVDFFDIGIKKGETSRYVSLPHEESFYCVEFVLLSDSKEIIIDRSRIVKTTRDHINYVLDDNAKLKKIVELSGYSNCDIIEESRKSLNRILPMDSMDEEE
ncbi:DUF4912 domain-containing protein [Thiospirochaeta perfilievii]|uniref:DUF4912 domain-containing protein n=1 Tax=Thiospirochaeta perfilievii TaxID=252967 RepID=A0A5C1Q6R3_9SPIO|nr:DUF4912 domain-containing protein [Thiospirochaeta perfilievii]QEN03753.1 DUF4912 domain-containing protein [Thiospirochaeta perfilievii]